MRFSGWVKKFLSGAVLLTTVVGILYSNLQLKWFRTEVGESPEAFYIPSANAVRPLLLGHEAFLADLVWIRLLGYFADDLLRGGKLTYLEGLTDFATDLDPRFEKIYIWAGAVFMYSGGRISREKIEASNRILLKGWSHLQNDMRGWNHHPQYWMIPQMIGFNYAIELKDRKKGAPFIAATARIPGSPALYKTWAATLYRKAGEVEKATKVLEDMLALETLQSQLTSVKDPGLKKRIRNRLMFYYQRIHGKEGLQERIRLLEEKIRRLLQGWQDRFPYINLTLYMLLDPSQDQFSDSAFEATWDDLFPLSSHSLTL